MKLKYDKQKGVKLFDLFVKYRAFDVEVSGACDFKEFVSTSVNILNHS